MNLYDKLSPEALKVLDQEMEKYPTLTKGIIDSLKSNRYVGNLTLNEAMSISAAFGFETTAMNLFNFFK